MIYYLQENFIEVNNRIGNTSIIEKNENVSEASQTQLSIMLVKSEHKRFQWESTVAGNLQFDNFFILQSIA